MIIDELQTLAVHSHNGCDNAVPNCRGVELDTMAMAMALFANIAVAVMVQRAALHRKIINWH